MQLSSRLLRVIFGVCCVGTAGCYEVLPPPHVKTVAAPDELRLINPDEFRVNSDSYPEYVAVSRVEEPPAVFRYRTAPIEPTDSWRVTHRIGERLLIYSEQYEQRQCQYEITQATAPGDVGRIDRHGQCRSAPYLYYLFITADGEVRGWKLLKNPQRVVLARDRRLSPDAEEGTSDGWGRQPLFRRK